jgi:NADH:ubiquinone oxidoreductase subunit D
MHASMIVPGGVRGQHTSHWYHEVIAVLSTMCTRVDVLSAVLLGHRVWGSRLLGVGVIHYGSTSTSISGVMLRCVGVA